MAILVAVWITCNTIGLVSSSIQYTRETMPGAQYYDGKKLNIPISKEAGIELFERWTHQAISSIMACIATQYLSKLNEFERSRLQKCSRAAEDIHQQARCLVRAIDAKPKQIEPTRISRIQKLQKLLDGKQKKTVSTQIQFESHHIDVKPSKEAKKVEFRTRRSVINRHNYKLHTEFENLTPFGILGKYLSKMTKIIKNKDLNSSWKKTMYDIENIKQREQKKIEIAEQMRKRFPLKQYFENMKPKLILNEKYLAKELNISDHLLQRFDKTNVNTLEIAQLLQRAIKLALVLSGVNGTELENKTLKFGSPRLLSLVPDNVKDQINILSPSLFSVHDKGESLETLTSIPKLMNVSGNRDYEEWLNFIIEVSGTTEAIQELKEKQELDWLPPAYKSMPRGIDGQPLYFTKKNVTEIDPELARKVELFENLSYSLTPKQIAEFNTTGFSMMTSKQLMMFYGPQSPLNDSKSLEFFLSLSEDDMHRFLLNDIRKLASKHSSLKLRQKRQNILHPTALTTSNLATSALQLSVLSPSILTLSLLSPSILGITLLSPSVLFASFLSPSALSPSILSPGAMGIILLSPSAFNPSILSPGALTPAILSPSAFSPRILSPSILSPALLSPSCLNPSAFSSSAHNIVVLSPSCMSPSYWSHSFHNSVILSPSFNSPSFNSSSEGNTVIFSPSLAS
ncbi:hypothetical protein X798_04702 [Onchocerca flexuosa]|uniref:Uncharacterized protein n=1 Tax=Onchocerca flexuosa TaxID=387005 RepID=A0A238BSK9_9BILA|nr:hypothetical protein X798_04702 [Onchocerca flexuosa]